MTLGTSALLQTENLAVTIAGKQVCHNLNLEIEAGQCVGILGGNGAGKTTLLHTLAGLQPSAAGAIYLADEPLKNLRRRQIAQRLGLLMQNREDALPASVLETALIGRHPHIDFWQWESHTDIAAARRALKAVALDGLEQRPQTKLSGGERRRLAIATLLAQDPQVFLLDEPASELDLRHQLHLIRLFQTLAHKQGRAIIMSLHDVNLAARFCDSVLLVFGDGETRWGTPAKMLTPQSLEQLYHTPIERVAWRQSGLFVPV